MCELACDETSDWLMVDPWEAIQPEYQPTAVVLDHIAHEINNVLGGILAPTPTQSTLLPSETVLVPRKPARVMLLGGSDLLQTMSQPGVWSMSDLDHILGTYGIFVIERSGSVVTDALAPLKEWSERMGKDWVNNIHTIRQLIANDISSTRIRQFLRQGMSVQYLLPAVVISYIREHGLYGEHEEFKETRSSSMPPLCKLDGKGKAPAGKTTGAGRCPDVPEAKREGTKLWEQMGVDEADQTDGEVVVDGEAEVEVDDTRGRSLS